MKHVLFSPAPREAVSVRGSSTRHGRGSSASSGEILIESKGWGCSCSRQQGSVRRATALKIYTRISKSKNSTFYTNNCFVIHTQRQDNWACAAVQALSADAALLFHLFLSRISSSNISRSLKRNTKFSCRNNLDILNSLQCVTVTQQECFPGLTVLLLSLAFQEGGHRTLLPLLSRFSIWTVNQ